MATMEEIRDLTVVNLRALNRRQESGDWHGVALQALSCLYGRAGCDPDYAGRLVFKKFVPPFGGVTRQSTDERILQWLLDQIMLFVKQLEGHLLDQEGWKEIEELAVL